VAAALSLQPAGGDVAAALSLQPAGGDVAAALSCSPRAATRCRSRRYRWRPTDLLRRQIRRLRVPARCQCRRGAILILSHDGVELLWQAGK